MVNEDCEDVVENGGVGEGDVDDDAEEDGAGLKGFVSGLDLGLDPSAAEKFGATVS